MWSVLSIDYEVICVIVKYIWDSKVTHTEKNHYTYGLKEGASQDIVLL